MWAVEQPFRQREVSFQVPTDEFTSAAAHRPAPPATRENSSDASQPPPSSGPAPPSTLASGPQEAEDGRHEVMPQMRCRRCQRAARVAAIA